MAAQTEEWILKLIDQATGTAATADAAVLKLATSQLKAAAAATQLNAVQAVSAARLAAISSATDGAAAMRAAKADDMRAASAAKAAAAEQKLAAAQAKANVAGMAAMGDILNKKHEADAKAALLAAKASEASAKAKLAEGRAQVAAETATAKAAATAAKAAGAKKPGATGGADDPSKVIGKKAAIKDVLGGEVTNIANAAKAAGGPLGAVAEKVESLAGIIGRVPGPVGAAIVALAALVAVATAGAVALYKMADAALTVVAQRAQLLATFGALSGGGAGGAKTLAIVDKLGVSLPFATAKIAEWATGLQKAGLQGRSLESAVKAVAAAQALMGESGAAAASQLIETLAKGGAGAISLVQSLKMGLPDAKAQLAEMGLRVEDLAAALGMSVQQFRSARLGAKQMAEAVEKALAKKAVGPLADLFLTFPNLIGKVKEGFLSLFDKLGPAIRPFMTAVKGLFGEFSKGGGAINFLKPIVTSVMTTVFQWATRAVVAIRGIVKAFTEAGKGGGVFGGVVSVIKTVVGILLFMGKVVAAPMGMLLAFLKAIFTNATVLKGIRVIFTVIAVAIGIVVVVVGALIAAVGLAVSIFASLAGALAGMVTGGISAAVGFIDGIVGGITNGAGAVIGAITALAGSAVGAFKAALGIASPSKVMMAMGGHTVAGFTEGVDDGTDKAEASMSKMVTPKAGKGAKGGAKDGKGGLIANFYNCVFGGGITQDQVDAMMQSWWERLANEQEA